MDPPVAIVITSEPEKVIDVFVSPSPAIESNCSDPTFVKLESPRSSVPVTVRFPVMSVFAFNFIAPVPAGSSVRSALLGDAIDDPTMTRCQSRQCCLPRCVQCAIDDHTIVYVDD